MSAGAQKCVALSSTGETQTYTLQVGTSTQPGRCSIEFVDYAIPEKVISKDFSYEEVVIVPIGDVHFGAKGFAHRSFMDFRNSVEKEYGDKQIYYLGMGDYVDAYRATVRKAFLNLAPDDGDAIDDYMYERLDEFYHMMHSTKGKWLGLLGGNHTWTFRHGGTFETELAKMLDTDYLGDCADVQMKFSSSGKSRGSVGIWAHHGVGGRKYPVGKLIDDICPHFPDSDIFLMGHVHLREYRDFIRMRRVGKQYVDQVGVAAITGGWLKGYIEGPSTYVERKAMKPRAVGGLVLKVRPRMVHGIWAPRIRMETI